MELSGVNLVIFSILYLFSRSFHLIIMEGLMTCFYLETFLSSSDPNRRNLTLMNSILFIYFLTPCSLKKNSVCIYALENDVIIIIKSVNNYKVISGLNCFKSFFYHLCPCLTYD